MDLLERYLNTVKPLLPRETRGDILQELSDNILSQMEEKAEGIDRPLTEPEQAEVIKKHGHPVVVAARYGRVRYLIGPAVFPFYWLTLRIAALGALLVRLIVAIIVVLVNPNPGREVFPALIAVPYVLVPVFCWVTGFFALYEVCHLNLRLNWDPRSLPEIDKHATLIPRTHSAAEIIFGIAGLVWWQMLPVAPYLALGPAAQVITLNPIWSSLYWPVLLLTVAYVTQSVLNLLHPHVTTARSRARLLIHAIGLVVLYLAIRLGNWVAVAPGVRNPSEYGGLVHIVNQVLFYCFTIGLVIGGVQFAWECVRLGRWACSHSESHPSQAIHRS
jgi:hypothetical protein